MSRFKRLQVLNSMLKLGMIPVFHIADVSLGKEIIRACYEGGAYCIEMTNRGDHAIDVFRELELYCKNNLPGVILGVGSIVDAPTAAMYIAYGAGFVVGPAIDEETAILCNKRKITYIPGCGSLSEIHRAEALGVEICKVFPGKEVGGPGFIKSVLGPCPWSSLMPTGGVEPTVESLTSWFEAGAVCTGIGSQLITKEILKNRDFALLTRQVQETLEIIVQIKKALK